MPYLGLNQAADFVDAIARRLWLSSRRLWLSFCVQLPGHIGLQGPFSSENPDEIVYYIEAPESPFLKATIVFSKNVVCSFDKPLPIINYIDFKFAEAWHTLAESAAGR